MAAMRRRRARVSRSVGGSVIGRSVDPAELDARHVPHRTLGAVAEPNRFCLETARRLMRQIVLAVAWLAAVVLIALGAAGIVAGMDAPATTDAYPWQTA